MARKYPTQGEQKVGEEQRPVKRVSSRVLPSKVVWVERGHPSMLTYPGKTVKRPQVILSCEAFKWCTSGRNLNYEEKTCRKSLLANKSLIYCVRSRLFREAELVPGGKSSLKKPITMSKGALRKGADVTRSRGKIVLIQGSDVAQTQQEVDNTGRLALSGVYTRLAAKGCRIYMHIT